MGKEILNRRQNIYTENVPPEIADTSGFVEATDYATSTTGGTVKVDGTYQIELTSGGKLKAKEVTAANYESANDAAFISKKTLDNLIAAGTLGVGMIMDEVYSDESASNAARTITIADFASYKFFIIVCAYQTNVNATILPPVPCMSTSDNYLVNVKIGSDMGKINVTHLTATTLETEATSAQLTYHVYGIK